MAADSAVNKATSAATSFGKTALKWLPGIFMAAVIAGTVIGAPAATLLAADPTAGVGQSAWAGVKTIFNNAVQNTPEALRALSNTVSAGANGLASVTGP